MPAKKPEKKPAKPPPSDKTIANAIAKMTAFLAFSPREVKAEARVEGGKTIFAEKGVDVASLELDGAELVVEFVAPTDRARFADVMEHYEPVEGKPAWLRFRRPATSTPTPSLEAKLGQVYGAAIHERK